jgi:hypothetical protein
MNRIALILAALLAVPLFAQTPVSQTEKPSREATEERFYRDGSNNLEYHCVALATQPQATVFTRSLGTSYQPNMASIQGTLTSIVVLTNVGTVTTSVDHGYSVGQWITVAGATVDAQLNGNYKIASVPSGTTFTITTASVADATYNESSLKFTSSAPRTNANVWAIRKFYYTTTYIDRSVPAKGVNDFDKACSSRTSYF